MRLATTLAVTGLILLTGCAAPSVTAPSPSGSAPGSPTITTPASTPPLAPSAAATPTRTGDQRVRDAMLSESAMKTQGLTTDPLTVGDGQRWSATCNVEIKTDQLALSGGYRAWKLDGKTRVLEVLNLYAPQSADQALTEGYQAAKSCTRYQLSGLDLQILPPVQLAGGVLTYCQRTPNNYVCTRATVRGDYLSWIAAFGASQDSARALTDRIAGMAMAQLEKAG